MNDHRHIHQIGQSGMEHAMGILPQLILAMPFLLVLIGYLFAVIYSSRRYKPWPIYRTACWILGVLLALISVAGPLAERAHSDFTFHMIGHLLLGMLAPLLLVLAAPITLLLRTLSIPKARRLAHFLRGRLSRLYTHPVFASVLNIGGLWLLYTTELFSMMHEHTLLHILIHFHVFAAGYLFTVSMIYIDPVAHRLSFLYRSIVLVLALAAHGILSKFIYANPPAGIPVEQAERGGMLMYYGGDAVDVIIIFILCLQWYRAGRPRVSSRNSVAAQTE